MKIRPVAAELFHADRQTDRHGQVNIRFSQFCKVSKKGVPSNGDAQLKLFRMFRGPLT